MKPTSKQIQKHEGLLEVATILLIVGITMISTAMENESYALIVPGIVVLIIGTLVLFKRGQLKELPDVINIKDVVDKVIRELDERDTDKIKK